MKAPQPVELSAEATAATEEIAVFRAWEMSDGSGLGPTLGDGSAQEAATDEAVHLEPTGCEICDCRTVLLNDDNASVIVGTQSLGLMECGECAMEPACDYCSRGASTLPTAAGEFGSADDVSALWRQYDEQDLLEAF